MNLGPVDLVLIPVRYPGVISEQIDATLWHVLWEQLFWPENAVLSPCLGHVASKTVEEDEALHLCQNVTLIADWRHTRPRHLLRREL